MSVLDWIQLGTSLTATLAFSVLFHIRGIKLVAAMFGGGLSWALFLLFHHVIEKEAICYFWVAILISLYAEWMATCLKAPVTIFIAPCLIPLVPGASLYYTMKCALEGGWLQFIDKAVHTLALGSALALGIVVSAVLMRLIAEICRPLRKREGQE